LGDLGVVLNRAGGQQQEILLRHYVMSDHLPPDPAERDFTPKSCRAGLEEGMNINNGK